MRAPTLVLGAMAATAACRTAEPPFGAVLIEVDTDVAVPRLVSSLRVDVYRDGVWVDTREVPLRDARLLPISFSVFSSEAAAPREALVRVRGFRDGAQTDAPIAPRLVRDGVDLTPVREPDPALAIDQLLRLTLVVGEEQRTRLVLRGACAGVAADVEGARTCTGEGRTLGEAPEASPVTDGSSQAGTFGEGWLATPAPRVPAGLDDGGEALVAGGAFVLGSRDLAANRAWGGVDVSSVPPRMVIVSSFLMDRYEVSVARFRRALGSGFVPPTLPVANDADFPATLGTGADTTAFCTYSAAPRAREAMPLSCVTFATARAFCAFAGGDLPTETEWEYAATAALRPLKTTYAFGDDDVPCAGAVFARTTLPERESAECVSAGFAPGPALVGTALRDATPSSDSLGGVRDLSGNVAEWTLDVYRDYADPCWSTAAQRDPTCTQTSGRRVTRGGAFTEPRGGMVGTLRKPAADGFPFAGLGFRCVRRAAR